MYSLVIEHPNDALQGRAAARPTASACCQRPYDCHCFDSSWRSKSADAATPASSAQKAELMPRIANGVTATMNATRRQSGAARRNSSLTNPAVRRGSRRPASAKTYDRGSTPTSAAMVVPAKAMSNVSNAEITTPQYRPFCRPGVLCSKHRNSRTRDDRWMAAESRVQRRRAIPTRTDTGFTATLYPCA